MEKDKTRKLSLQKNYRWLTFDIIFIAETFGCTYWKFFKPYCHKLYSFFIFSSVIKMLKRFLTKRRSMS